MLIKNEKKYTDILVTLWIYEDIQFGVIELWQRLILVLYFFSTKDKKKYHFLWLLKHTLIEATFFISF